MPHRWRRRQVVQGAGAMSLGLLAGCGRLPWQAPPPARIPRVGYLAGGPRSPNTTEAFQQGLRDLGYIEGKNVAIEWRLMDGQLSELFDAATELVGLPVDIIVATGPPAIAAARRATDTIPIIMASSDDPVGAGFVASLARPGGNVTGLSSFLSELSGKRLELLLAAFPSVSRVALLWDPNDASHAVRLRETELAAQARRVQVVSLQVGNVSAFNGAFEAALREQADGLMVAYDGFMSTHRARIVEFAATHGLPAMYDRREFVDAGGLMAYAAITAESFRRAASYVDKILKGTSPADLPIEQPMRFDFVINLKTAQALGLTIPPHVLLQATEVLQ
jgi:putative tryptophan/tyrosine transport system substrate-binding protein